MSRCVRSRFGVVVVLLLLATLAGVLLGGCGQREGAPKQALTIGAAIPLSGKSATIGELHKRGIEIAVEQLNAEGGVNGQPVKIVYEDTKNDAKTGISAYRKLVDVNRVPAVIATFSGVCVPIAAAIESGGDRDGVVFFATATSAPAITEKSKWVFRAFLTSDVESPVLAKFAAEKLKARRAASYYVNDDYGKGAADEFKRAFEGQYGGSVVFSEAYDITALDHRSAVLKIRAARPDVIFCMGYGQGFPNALKQIREAGITAPIVSTATLALPDSLSLAGDAAEGAYLTASLYDENAMDPATAEFVRRYVAEFGKPTNYQSAATYLCTMMIAEAAKKKGVSAQEIHDGLMAVRDFPSPLGNITIDANREGQFPVEMKRIHDGRVTDLP